MANGDRAEIYLIGDLPGSYESKWARRCHKVGSHAILP